MMVANQFHKIGRVESWPSRAEMVDCGRRGWAGVFVLLGVKLTDVVFCVYSGEGDFELF